MQPETDDARHTLKRIKTIQLEHTFLNPRYDIFINIKDCFIHLKTTIYFF